MKKEGLAQQMYFLRVLEDMNSPSKGQEIWLLEHFPPVLHMATFFLCCCPVLLEHTQKVSSLHDPLIRTLVFLDLTTLSLGPHLIITSSIETSSTDTLTLDLRASLHGI